MKIKKLPADARSKLQSGIVVTDAVQCILELVHNSLDAEATAVAIRIDLKRYQIQVIDNGKGIPRDDLELVGKRFMTSKYQSLENKTTTPLTYGFKGQAISSLLDVCKTLMIKTKSESNGPSLVKTFQSNIVLPIHESEAQGSEVGTTVIVEDFMSNMPVRRKRISEVFDVEEIKTQLQYLAVIHYNVSFTLRNDNKGLILFQKHPAESLLQSISNTFGKTIIKHLKTVNYKNKDFEISGFISVKPQKQSNMQLLYINKRIITKCVIHKFVNNLMKECIGSTVLLEETLLENDLLKKLRSANQNVFILLVKCPHTFYELFTNSWKTTIEFKNWKEALKCVSKALKKAFKVDEKTLDETFKPPDHKKIEPIHETKAKFGTSLLINAIRGAPVKRALKRKKDSTKRRKKKDAEDITELDLSFLVVDNKKDENSMSVKTTVNTSYNDLVNCTHDSLESPIPRNHIKPFSVTEKSSNSGSKQVIRKSSNSSLNEFYTWLKLKFETEVNAFNLYSEFMQFKKKENDITFRENPGLEAKISKPSHAIKFRSDNTYVSFNESTAHHADLCDERSEIQDGPSRIQKGFQILREKTTETHTYVPVKRHLNSDAHEISTQEQYLKQKAVNYKSSFDVASEAFKQLHQVSSPATSEVIFTNLIKFRNLSESFIRQPLQTHTATENYHESDMDTWTSHYQNQVTAHMTANENIAIQRKDNYLLKKIRKYKQKRGNIRSYNNNEYFDDMNRREFQIFSFENRKSVVECRDAEIQTDVTDMSCLFQKVSVMVQTVNNNAWSKSLESEAVGMVPETPSFEIVHEFTNHQETDCDLEISYHKTPAEDIPIISQEVPNPDFWNFPTPENLGTETNVSVCFEPQTDSDQLKNLKSTKHPSSEKKSLSSELVCGQKSNSGKAPQTESSTSKETQTLAQMWTDCLQEIVHSENLTSGTVIESSNQLPVTIPIEEIKDGPDTADFCLTERHDFIPKGLSPENVFSATPRNLVLSSPEKNRIKSVINNTETDSLASVKWQDGSTGVLTKPLIPEGILIEMRQKATNNLVFNENEILSASLSYCAIKIHNLLHSFAFTKELLSNIEILGQLDKKFIVAKMEVSVPKIMSLISLFDQHAVDERIRLEELMQVYVDSDGKLISSKLNPSIECPLNESLVQVVESLENKFLKFGLNIKIVNEKTISLLEIPTFLMDKHEKNLTNKKEDTVLNILQDLIANVVDEIKETRGATSKIPKIIHNAFCLEACRKAIKFNRGLTREEMEDMINKLRICKLPFQCAHGRPSVIPIIDLEDFKPSMENENNHLNNLKKFVQERNLDFVGNSNKLK